MNLDGEEFPSHRVEYYYLCTPTTAESEQFGIDGEFTDKNKSYKKVKLALDEIKKLDPADINDMNQETYKMLIEYLENN